MVAAGLIAGGQAQLPAQSPVGDGTASQRPAESGPRKPSENAPKPGEAGEKPAGGSAQKPLEEGAARLRLMSILGREVVNREGDGGRIIDVLVDADGRSGAVVVEFGGFMGIGSRKVAVHWSALRFVREGDRTAVIVDVTRDQIRDATEYKQGEPATVLSTK
jgi:hypothetical protein